MPSIDRLTVWSEVVYISKVYKGLDPLGLRVLQKLCSESPLLVPRPGVPFVGKNKTKQKANTGKCFRDYDIIYLILFYPFNAMFNFYKASRCLQFTAYSWNNRCVRICQAQKWRQGHPTGNFEEKKTSKQQQSVNKAFWSHFQHFGRLLEKMYLFLTPPGPARLTEEFPTNKVHLQPATWLTGEGGGGRKLCGPEGRFLTNKTYQLFYLNPELPFSQQHFPSKDMSFLPHLPASKHFPEEQIFRGKDPLAASVTWY